jgi:hypothetical protein
MVLGNAQRSRLAIVSVGEHILFHITNPASSHSFPLNEVIPEKAFRCAAWKHLTSAPLSEDLITATLNTAGLRVTYDSSWRSVS